MSFWADVCTHTSFFIIFLAIFYFTFVTYIQTESLSTDLFNIIQTNFNTSMAFSTSDNLNKISQEINSKLASVESTIPPPKTNNATIILVVEIVVGILGPVLLLLGLYLQYINNESITDLLVSNIVVILFIAVSELFIVGMFLRNFIEIDSKFISAIIPAVNSQYYKCDFVAGFLDTFLPSGLVKYF